MLSSQCQGPGFHHKRQMSTPAFNPETATEYFPIAYPQPSQHSASHRRGLSLDQTMRLQDIYDTNPGNGTITTNQGFQQQQTMRETQMRGLSRPGQINNLDDIFDISKVENLEEDFGDFGSFGVDESFSTVMGSMHASVLTPPILPQHHPSRPRTPRAQLAKNEFPMTPQSGLPSQECFTQSSPIRHGSIDFGQPMQSQGMKRGSSYQEFVQIKRSQCHAEGMVSAPNTAPMRTCATFDVAPMPTSDFLDMAALDFDFTDCNAGYESSNYSPTRTSPAISSRRSSPDLPPVTLFGEVSGGVPNFAPSDLPSAPSSPSKARSSSPRKKAQPLPEEMAIEDTGITTEQVDAFIQGPDTETNKFSCLFEGCKMGPFGRKENIRAHVQTHLGDRKYVCTVCSNRFVRPNDLKRHSVIHQEVKEFTCRCGAAFGRQDALRRHRIRKPYCVNGDPNLELMRREEKKRGRPRKIAPTETNERRERKEHIRKQVMAKKRNDSLGPSVASTCASGRSCSPEDYQQSSAPGFSPSNMSLTPPASPQQKDLTIFTSQLVSAGQQNKGKSPSPPPTRDSMTAAFSHDGMDFGNDSPFTTDPFGRYDVSSFSPTESQAKSPSSSPPGLDLSSSPPAPRFLDLSESLDLDFTNHSAQGSFDDFTSASSATTFDDDFFSTNNLMDQILKETRASTAIKPDGAVINDVERLVFFDSM